MNPQTFDLDESIDPIALGAHSGMLWAGDQIRLAGLGEALRLPVDRPGGAEAAQAALREIAGDATLDRPGRGVAALAAFPFDPDEAGELVVPRVILGADGDGAGWLTTIDTDPRDALAEVRRIAQLNTHSPEIRERVAASVVPPDQWRDDVVGAARDRIRSGAMRKAVMAREIVVRGDAPIDQAAVVAALRRRFPSTNLFSLDGFVGASPELLVGRMDDVVRAHPLAGTMPRSKDPVTDARTVIELIASTKNQWEHRITIEWLLDTLLPFCSYVDAEPEPTVVSLANVHHLGTRVQGVLSSPAASVLELVAALHPTPAVGGDPQDAALALIDELEPGARGRYAGAVGWVDARGNGAFAVAIRSAQIDGASARLWAGVGVVADSDPVAELAETQAKFEAMLSVLVP